MTRHFHHSHHISHLQPRQPAAAQESRPMQLRQLVDGPLEGFKSLVRRGSTDSSTCSNGGSGSQCSSGSSNVSVPVALGVVIPLVLAVGIFVYLHRRHVKKLRSEDLNDPHKSLDFGWDPSAAAPVKGRAKGRKNMPEMTVMDVGSEKGSRRERGLSMDMDLPSPYLLPPGVHGSRESMHSISRTIHSQDDRYRPATSYNANDSTSLHSHPARQGTDDASISSGPASAKRGSPDNMEKGLLVNAQRMSRSLPPANRIPEIQVPEPAREVHRKALPSTPVTPSTSGLSPGGAPLLDSRESYMGGDDLRKSNNYLGPLIHSREPSSDVGDQESKAVNQPSMRDQSPATQASTLQRTPKRKAPPSIIKTKSPDSLPPRGQSLRTSSPASTGLNFYDDSSEYGGEGSRMVPQSPHSSQPDNNDVTRRSSQAYMPPIEEFTHGVEATTEYDDAGFGYDVQRLSMGLRPLPPDDPTDNPEQRANRIRSFYKEYFDDSKPAPKGAADYYEDYDQDYLGDGAMFDPVSGHFITAGGGYLPPQHTEPYGRRAMTPPPRAPPRFGRQHAATMSGGSRLMPPGPRALSSASGRFGPSGRGPPKKVVPPPQPLHMLPTPHLLKEDAFALSIDFAPPTSVKDRQAGRPESPRGGMRAYSPGVRAHTPLATSFDDLAVMPSPHLLRRSGTFTALDFAAPPRFRTQDTASDAGSIRSNRSGVSAVQQNAIRKGAYRVSRIPKEVVGTKGDLMSSLKPSWNMHNNSGTIGMST